MGLVTLAFLLSIAYWPGISGGSTTPRWALLSVFIPFLLMFHRVPLTVGHLCGIFFLGYAGISIAWAPYLQFALNAYWQLILMAGAFAIGSSLTSLRSVLIALGLGFAVNGMFVIMQGIWWNPWHYLETPGNPNIVGSFINGNLLSECTAITLIGLAAYRVWWLALLQLPAIILPWTNGTPRGPIVAIAVALIAWLWTRRPIIATHIAGLLMICGILVIGGHNDSVYQRYNFWIDTIKGINTWWGHGIGSYYITFPEYSEHSNTLISRPENAHNDWLEYIYELGIGVIPLIYLIGIALRSNKEPERLMLLGAITISVVGFPLHMPTGQFMAALTAGCLCGSWLPLRYSLVLGRIRIRERVAAIKGRARGGWSSGVGDELVPGVPAFRASNSELLRRRALAGFGPDGNSGDQEVATGRSVGS